MARKKLYTDEDMAIVSDNPPWTDEEIARAIPARDFFTPEQLASLIGQKPRARGPQKAPTKELVSLRLSRETWQPFAPREEAGKAASMKSWRRLRSGFQKTERNRHKTAVSPDQSRWPRRESLGTDEREMRRVLDPIHATKLTRLVDALRVLGQRLVVGVEKAA
jgi:uncharacterized protein (DUF4415 family)